MALRSFRRVLTGRCLGRASTLHRRCQAACDGVLEARSSEGEMGGYGLRNGVGVGRAASVPLADFGKAMPAQRALTWNGGVERREAVDLFVWRMAAPRREPSGATVRARLRGWLVAAAQPSTGAIGTGGGDRGTAVARLRSLG